MFPPYQRSTKTGWMFLYNPSLDKHLSRVMYCWWMISGSPPWDGAKTLQRMGATKPPQLVSQISKTINSKLKTTKETTHYQTHQRHEKSPFKTKENVKRVRFTCHKQEKRAGLSKLVSTNRCFLNPRYSCKLPTSKRCCCPCCRISSTSKRDKNLLWRIGAMSGVRS